MTVRIVANKNASPDLSKNQQGMALLTILLLLVAITIVAGSMLASQKLMQRQYALTQNQDQMREYALAGEAWASQLIAQDSQLNQSDSLHDSWAKPLAPLLMDNATITVKINDEASRFNLNNLYHDGKVDEQALALFRKLLIGQHINLEIANGVLDWQDPDSDPRAEGGAEYEFYQSTGKAMPMPIANQPFVSVDELAMVRGVTKSDFAKLKPLVTAVPFFLPLNVNTAKPELLVAMFAIPEPVNPNNMRNASPAPTPASAGASTVAPAVAIAASQIESWAMSRASSKALNSINEFLALPVFAPASVSQKQAVQSLLDVRSQAFADVIKVSADGRELYLTSLLAKKSEGQNGLSQINASQNQGSPNSSEQSVVAFNRRILPFLPEEN